MARATSSVSYGLTRTQPAPSACPAPANSDNTSTPGRAAAGGAAGGGDGGRAAGAAAPPGGWRDVLVRDEIHSVAQRVVQTEATAYL